MLDNIKNLDDKDEFKIGETFFKINKMPALKAYHVFESIRKQLSTVMDSMDSSAGFDVLALKIISGLDESFVENIRVKMFENVFFQNKHSGNERAKLAGLEDSAFDGLEPIAIYEVLARCLAVNFLKSFAQIQQK